VTLHESQSDKHDDHNPARIIWVSDKVRFDIFVLQRVVLVVVATAFDEGARPGRSPGAEENKKGVLEPLSLDRIVISTNRPVVV
jgi:hypothetical protein